MIQLKQNYTIAIVTHNMQQAQRVADITAFFSVDISKGSRTGYLVESGPTKAALREPARAAHEGVRLRPVQLSRDAPALGSRSIGAGGGASPSGSCRRAAVAAARTRAVRDEPRSRCAGPGRPFPRRSTRSGSRPTGSRTRTSRSPTTWSAAARASGGSWPPPSTSARATPRCTTSRSRAREAGARLVPVTAGIVVLAYNLPGLERPAAARAGRVRRHLRRPHPDLGRSPHPRRQPGPQSAASHHRRRGAPGQQRDDLRAHQPPERGQQRLARSGAGRGHPRRLARARHAGARQRGRGRPHQGQRGLDRLRGVPLRQAARALHGPAPEQERAATSSRTSRADRPRSPTT